MFPAGREVQLIRGILAFSVAVFITPKRYLAIGLLYRERGEETEGGGGGGGGTGLVML